MPRAPANILVVNDESVRIIGTVDDHLRAFEHYSENRVLLLDSRRATSLPIALDAFDVVAFHYSTIVRDREHVSNALRREVSGFAGLKILFIQDEYRWIDQTAQAIRELGIDVIFTVVNEDVVREVYYHPWCDDIRFEFTLTGFVPQELVDRAVPSYADRPIDVAYRARKLPSSLGAFGQQKWLIGERFNRDAGRYGLVCDISSRVEDRLYGRAWADFLSTAKATLNTESGASVLDFTGALQQELEQFERDHPETPFQDIQTRFLKDHEGKAEIRVISPRCFEAAALRTLMIAYPGAYSGILQPDRHYVPLLPDHSNMKDVVDILRSPERAEEIIDRAYREIACSGMWTFRAMVEHFDHVVREELEARRAKAVGDRGDRISEQAFAAMRRREHRVVRLNALRRRTASSLQAMRIWMFDALQRLPAPLGRPLLFAARTLSRPMKPILRRLRLR